VTLLGALPEILTVGELARRSGVSVSALHFWEREGLIEGWRSAGNQRRFERSTLRRVAIIKVAQSVGIPLAEIRAPLFEEKVIDHVLAQVKVVDEPVSKEKLFSDDEDEAKTPDAAPAPTKKSSQEGVAPAA